MSTFETVRDSIVIGESGRSPLNVRQLRTGDSADEKAWDRFVRSTTGGTAFHLNSWRRVVGEVSGFTPHYMMALEGTEIRGALPLFEVRGLLSGHVLTSVPYATYGGLCSSEPAARCALLAEARKLAEQKRIRHVELRHLFDPQPDLPSKSLYVAFSKAMEPDPEVNFAKIPRKQRRMVRQGIKHGLEARRGWEHLSRFYEIYTVNRRHLGSPPFPLRLFEAVRDHFDEQETELLTIWHGGRLMAGVISLFYGDRVMPYYGAAAPEGLRLAVNDFMYWEVMRESCKAGYRVFDFGRSREGTGPYNFKRHWGFEPETLAYQFLLIGDATIPDISPSSPRLQLFIKAWKRLPLGVTKWVGPALTRWLPLD